MTKAGDRPYQWDVVLVWTISLFLWWLSTYRPQRTLAGGNDLAFLFMEGALTGLIVGVAGGIVVGVWKYFRPSKRVSQSDAIKAAQNIDKAVFVGCAIVASILVGAALLTERPWRLIDAGILIILGFGIKRDVHSARWLLVIGAFLEACIIKFTDGGNASVWSLVFLGACLTIVARRNLRYGLQTDVTADASAVAAQVAGVAEPLFTSPARSGKLSEKSLSISPPSRSTPIKIDEEEIYERIGLELESNSVDKAAWTKAFAQSEGDDKKTRALYINFRFEKLMELQRNVIWSERVASERTERLREEVAKNEAEQRNERLRLKAENEAVQQAELRRQAGRFESAALARRGQPALNPNTEAPPAKPKDVLSDVPFMFFLVAGMIGVVLFLAALVTSRERIKPVSQMAATTSLPAAGTASSSPSVEQRQLPPCPEPYQTATWTNCVGAYSLADGGEYVGEFKDGKRNGHGTFKFPSGEMYVGRFSNGEPNGQGIDTLPSGQRYEGEFKDGKRNGQGTMMFPDGSKYVGVYIDDNRTGHGTMTFPDGETYVGEFKNGKREGQGAASYPDGMRYVGNFKDNGFNGQGTLFHADGSALVGEFKDGHANGYGTHTTPNGGKYIGDYKNGKVDGRGTLVYPDGGRLVGEFSQGTGWGSEYKADGVLLRSGYFERFRYVGSKPQLQVAPRTVPAPAERERTTSAKSQAQRDWERGPSPCVMKPAMSDEEYRVCGLKPPGK